MKDIRFLALFSILIMFTVGVLITGCGSNDEPPVVFPPSDELRVAYISPSLAPTIDGQAEGVWDNAQLSQLTALASSDNNPKGRVALLELKALSDSTNLYIYARWRDEGGNDERYRQWLWSSEGSIDPWRKDLSRDDVFAVLFETDTDTSAGMGCVRFCHELGPGNNEFINKTDNAVDGWFWRATQTNPMGKALDLNFVDTIYADSGTLGLDPEDMSGFWVNEVDSGGEAKWWTDDYKIDTVIVSIEQDTTVQDTTVFDTTFLYRIDIGTSLLASDTVDFQLPSETIDSVYIPAFIISTDASGDRWDVDAKAVYDVASKYWTLELKRPLNTGSDKDITFSIDSEYKAHFAVAVDYLQSHIGFDPIILKF